MKNKLTAMLRSPTRQKSLKYEKAKKPLGAGISLFLDNEGNIQKGKQDIENQKDIRAKFK